MKMNFPNWCLRNLRTRIGKLVIWRLQMQAYLVNALIALVAFVIGFISYRYIGADNAVEEECEKIIEDVTGKKIDISPS
jgi:hypothetical protein